MVGCRVVRGQPVGPSLVMPPSDLAHPYSCLRALHVPQFLREDISLILSYGRMQSTYPLCRYRDAFHASSSLSLSPVSFCGFAYPFKVRDFKPIAHMESMSDEDLLQKAALTGQARAGIQISQPAAAEFTRHLSVAVPVARLKHVCELDERAVNVAAVETEALL